MMTRQSKVTVRKATTLTEQTVEKPNQKASFLHEGPIYCQAELDSEEWRSINESEGRYEEHFLLVVHKGRNKLNNRSSNLGWAGSADDVARIINMNLQGLSPQSHSLNSLPSSSK